MTEALASDFEAAFREAYDRYARDNNSEDPNEAPKACWPSAREFRNILFKAGQHQGLAAEKYLNRILDPDLRLFAQIELCATVEGVPQIGGCIVTQRSKMQSCSFCSPGEPEEIFGPVIRVFVVPKCKWTARSKNLWSCSVGIIGIHSTLADSAQNAVTSGKKRGVASVAKCRHTGNGMKDEECFRGKAMPEAAQIGRMGTRSLAVSR